MDRGIGITRPLDGLGRIVIAREYRELMGVNAGDQVLHTLVADESTGRVRGVLLEPIDWVINPENAPLLNDALRRLKEKGDGR